MFDKYSLVGVVKLCEGIFSSLQVCVRVCLPCPDSNRDAKNSVGAGQQSHVRLNLSRMLFRVTYI